MITKKEYEKIMEVIGEIPDNQVKKPKNIPVGVYIQEAENLYHWCQPDKDVLIDLGLSWELVTDLPTRSETLKQAESIWITQRLTKKESTKKWEEQSPAAYDLRNELLECFRFAFRNDNELLGKIRGIARGDSHADMIQDLMHLAELGKNNPGLLADINFDISLLDRAIDTSKQMMQVLSKANADKFYYINTKIIRNRAYTHLKQAVDQIYEYGQFAFRHTPDRRKGYRSNYMYMLRKKPGKSPVNRGKSPADPVSPEKNAAATAKVGTP